MKMTSMQIERTLQQFDAEAIPAEHPAASRLESIFGNHTYFLDVFGLNIVEPVAEDPGDHRRGIVVNVASWADANAASLQPHAPEPTDLVIDLEADSLH